ncbi:MAG: transglycosylase SLT domain-containing protein [Desulfobacterales bacterium]
MQKRIGMVVALLLMVGAGSPLSADIYMYRDADGVMHFTNTPSSPEYRLYIRTHKPRFSSPTNHRQYDRIIREASRRHGVDFFLLKAVIQAESSFNPRAVSKKGARGLMQIMPENYPALNINDPFDPRQNIMGGTFYLRTLYDRYEGKLALTLSAYNAGPTIVDRYQRIPPIAETERYVEKVMRYYRHYKDRA